MMRSLTHMTRVLAAAASLALPAVAAAQNTPIVAVLPFDNAAFGPAASEYAGLGKGIQDLAISELASNTRIRLVDRDKIQTVLQEQNLIKAGSIDPQTAVRLGRILGVQYVVTGSYILDTKSGNAILTSKTIDVETTQIGNPQKMQAKLDNILEGITNLSAKINTDIKVDAKPGRRVGDAGTSQPSTTPAQSGTPAAAASKPAESVELFAKPMTQKARSVKLDAKTANVYATALDEMDKKNKTKAIALFTQVLDKYKDFSPAQEKLDKLQKAGD